MSKLKDAGIALKDYALAAKGNVKNYLMRRKLANKISKPINIPEWKTSALDKSDKMVMGGDYKGAEKYVRSQLEKQGKKRMTPYISDALRKTKK